MLSKEKASSFGASFRSALMGVYATSKADGDLLAHRYLYEISETLIEIHGRKATATFLYGVSDAVTSQLPVEDFRLMFSEPKPEVANPKTFWERIVATVDHFYLAFALGVFVEWFIERVSQ